MLCRIRIAHIAGLAALLVALAAPGLARDLGVKLGGAGVSAGIPGLGSTGSDLGLGAEGSWGGGTDLSLGADGQAATPAATIQSTGSAGSLPPGLDRFAIQGDGKANVSLFYKVLKTKF